MAHPIRPDKVIEMNNFYTLTVYEKGSEVIRMIHTLLGEEQFQAGMQLYVHRHDGSAATCDDFVQAMEDASNVDLTLFRRWYSQSGTPLVTVRDSYDADKKQYQLHVTQMTPPTPDQQDKQPLHIPFDIELYGSNGDVLALRHEGEPLHSVLNITRDEQTFAFDDVSEKPVPSLFREFSAPVKVDYPYTDAQLAFLMQHARNEFARWDAAQSLLASHIKENIRRYQAGEDLQLPEGVTDAFRAVLLDEQIDPALAAQILTLPSETEVAEWFLVVDPDAINAVMTYIAGTFARELADELYAVYVSMKTGAYQIDHADIAKRDLRNVCLGYLALDEDKAQADKRVSQQYAQADNMTDSLAALTAAVKAALPCRDKLLADYDNKWHQDGLVMDKWFILQATRPDADVLDNVKSLLTHRSFTMANPNRCAHWSVRL